VKRERGEEFENREGRGRKRGRENEREGEVGKERVGRRGKWKE
jgi:hypothetical protein